MQERNKSNIKDGFIVVVDIVETSPITATWLFLSSNSENPFTQDASEAEFFSTQRHAEQALAICKLPTSIKPFIFPVTRKIEKTVSANWTLAYKLLKDRGLS